jgi:HD-like signal output (HDOD) protein
LRANPYATAQKTPTDALQHPDFFNPTLMNTWLNKLLKNEQPAADHAAERLLKPQPPHSAPKNPQQLRFGLQCTPPIGQKKSYQPPEVLQRFTPFNTIEAGDLGTVAHKTLRYNAGSVIFLQGSLADAVYYILNGSIELHPDTDDHFDLSIRAPTQPIASYEITAHTAPARLPLNSGKLFGATAIAKTTVDIITLSHEVSQSWIKRAQEKSTDIDFKNIHLPNEFNTNPFFIHFAQAYHKNTLQLPSLPNVAIKLRTAMQGDLSIRDAVNIIQIDPAIVSKLIQVANSPLYNPANPITSCHDAVSRLGLNATRNLVMGINLKQLFQCKNKLIMQHMQNAWKQSLLVSSLCFVLAEEIGGINPEEALLAGLVNDIGIIPLLHFAQQHPDGYTDFQEIIAVIPYLRAPVGRLVLHTLGFSEALTEIPYDAENWFYDSGEKTQLIDIVILAKLHSYLGTEKAKELPYINAIPAYSKLKNGKLSPDFSLSILHKAQQRIQATMNILA